MLAYTFFPALLFVCDPTFANVLFLPRGGIYASFDHWTLHLPIGTRTSWTFANKLEYRIRLFKNKFAANFAEHRHKIRSDLADSIWGKFMMESDSLDREMNVTMAALQHLKTPNPAREKRSLLPFVGDALSVLKEQISMLKSRSHYHFHTVTVPAVSVTSVLLVVGFVLLVIKCVRRPSVSLSFLSKVSSRPKNPFPNRPTADDLTTNCAADSPSTPLEPPESGQVAPLATIAPTALSWLSHDPTDRPTQHHATQRT